MAEKSTAGDIFVLKQNIAVKDDFVIITFNGLFIFILLFLVGVLL